MAEIARGKKQAILLVMRRLVGCNRAFLVDGSGLKIFEFENVTLRLKQRWKKGKVLILCSNLYKRKKKHEIEKHIKSKVPSLPISGKETNVPENIIVS